MQATVQGNTFEAKAINDRGQGQSL